MNLAVAIFYDISPFVTGEAATSIDGIAYASKMHRIKESPRDAPKQKLKDFISTQPDVYTNFKSLKLSLERTSSTRFDWDLVSTFELVVRIFDAGGTVCSKGTFPGSDELSEMVLILAHLDTVSVLEMCKISSATERIKRLKSKPCILPHKHVIRDCEHTPILIRSVSLFHEKTFGKQLPDGVSRIALSLAYLPSQFVSIIVRETCNH